MADALPQFELILFGATGDLAQRKLLPALYYLALDKQIHPQGRIIALGRSDMGTHTFVDKLFDSIKSKVSFEDFDEDAWHRFASRISYVRLDVNQADDFARLAEQLDNSIASRVFFLATHTDLYPPISQALSEQGLITDNTRIVLEKPIGNDFASSSTICDAIDAYFKEDQIYRIDHYLGKETVQNLLVLRFANTIFESQWNQKYIDHVQITVAESLGVEGRANFYEPVGAMRDILQNHLLQLLCITAMEPPSHLTPEAVSSEKVKVMKSLKPITGHTVADHVIRGQYTAGSLDETKVAGYLDEPGVSPNSHTETFVAMKVEIENWRWAGVPFYLRTGKRLKERLCEIVVQFKEVPHSIFDNRSKKYMSNRLVFRLQPDEGIQLDLCEKRTGAKMVVKPVAMSLSPDRLRTQRVPDAYERLLNDAIDANQTLFISEAELLAAWQFVDPILDAWNDSHERPEPYHAGSWGPAAATLLLARDGRLWSEAVNNSY